VGECIRLGRRIGDHRLQRGQVALMRPDVGPSQPFEIPAYLFEALRVAEMGAQEEPDDLQRGFRIESSMRLRCGSGRREMSTGSP
jgi:hypothetical protein